MGMRHVWKSIDLRSFLTTTVILTILAGSGLYMMYTKDVSSLENVLMLNEEMHNNMTSRAISLDLKSLFIDLQLVSNHVEVKRFLKSRDPENRRDLETEFIALCSASMAYDQVRILDNTGMEVVRVNYNRGHPAAVPPDQLQNKSSRYYFTEALPLKFGEVYVSPFDLNVEKGKIEQPLKPMLRVCMPVFDGSGQRLGIVVLNYLGQRILDDIKTSGNGEGTQIMLLNSDGYWLLSPDKSQEWAFMYKERKKLNFSNLHPTAWGEIKSSSEGQFGTPAGVYTYSTIEVAPRKETERSGNVRKWKVICFAPQTIINASMAALFQNYAAVYAGFLLFTLFGAMTRARFVRSRELGRINLEKARQEAEDANRTKSDFLARMSHEIRTPMNAIIGLTHLSLKTELSSKQFDYLNKISMSAQSLLGIINDILDFSKIEADRLEVEKVDFLLDDVLNNILNMLGLQAEQKGLEFLLMVRSTVPNLLIGDPLRLGQVLLNLTGNAIKFTEHGEVILSAVLVEEEGNQATIRFSIQDTGIGISQEQIDKLFQPFSQADGSITRQFGGTGLGLAISKRLVELMGGSMELTSEQGKGSEFSFTLPFELQARHTGEHHVYPEEIRGMRVLVVDDSKMSRKILGKVLQSFTFDVETAASGDEALSLIRQQDKADPFKLVITDWRMPDIDGIGLVSKIKNGGLFENIPKVIMLTAYGHEEVRHRAEQVDLDGFMLKPFNRSILFDTIMEVFVHDEYRVKFTSSKPERSGVPPNVAGSHILLAEDNEINQQVAREMLEGAGIHVSIANNGQVALEMVMANTYDAVLMDIQMPVMDGFQAVKAIRSIDRLKDIPVIAMTAHALVGDKEKSLLSGMNDHVNKPIDPDVLMEALSKWLPNEPRSESGSFPPLPRAEDPSASFMDLPGIDSTAALRRVQGNSTLYEKLLVSFANDCSKMVPKALSLASAGEYEEARALVHSLKGVAGNLGANTLHQGFREVEAALSEKPDTATSLLESMDSERTRVVNGILAAFPQSEADMCTGESISIHKVKELHPKLRQLSDLLQKHDVEAREMYESFKAELNEVAPKFCAELGTMLAKFDFTGGRKRVEAFFLECDQQGEG